MLTLTYPGVYVEEISSGVHTITGVATSIAAFVGWAPQGPVDQAVLVQSWSEFQRQFGGLDSRSDLGYAINQFFGNGGQQAYIVRLAWQSTFTAAPSTSPVACATASSTGIGNATSIITASVQGVSGKTTLSVGAPTLTSIAVTLPNATMPAGLKQQLSVTGTFSDGSTRDLTSSATWNSSSAATATINTSGMATAVAAGTTNITAQVDTTTSPPVTLTVSSATLSSITVTPASPTLPVGVTQQFTATGTYSDNSVFDLTPVAAWNSGTAATATIGASTGLATAVAAGTTAITAKVGTTTSAPVTLTVSSATLSSITVTPVGPTIPVGVTQQFTATGTYSDSSAFDLTAVAAWNSGTAATATIGGSTGLATAVAAGTTAITAKVGAITSAPVTLTVSNAAPTSIDVTPANPTVQLNASMQFKAVGNYPDGSKQDLTAFATWTSGTPTVATVNSSGLATGIGVNPGALTLYANNPGAWGNALEVNVTAQPADPTRFGIQVLNAAGSTLENFTNLSTNPLDPLGRYVVNVIDSDSQYVTFVNSATPSQNPAPPNGTPAATVAPVSLSGGADGSVLNPATDGNFEVALLADPNGLFLLDRVPIFNLLCVPGETDATTIQALQKYCHDNRAFYIVDSPETVTTAFLTANGPAGTTSGSLNPSSNLTGQYSINSAYYYPWVLAPDPLAGNRPALFPPCGFIAGIYATTDAGPGVWKAPAGIEASLTGVSGLQYVLTDLENGNLNIQAINCLRQFRVYGDVVWGSRTLQGNDQTGSEWKYVPIRRLALFLESSLYDGTQWVVFEPNDERLWSQIRLNVGAFMQGQFLQGAFQGTTPKQAYFVKCDAENNPQFSIDQGIVNILVGFAPLYPAEFVVIQIQQMAGQSQA